MGIILAASSLLRMNDVGKLMSYVYDSYVHMILRYHFNLYIRMRWRSFARYDRSGLQNVWDCKP